MMPCVVNSVGYCERHKRHHVGYELTLCTEMNARGERYRRKVLDPVFCSNEAVPVSMPTFQGPAITISGSKRGCCPGEK